MHKSTSPNLIIVSSGKGGIGKTTLSCTIADILELHDRTFQFIQVDDQDRLPTLYPDKVITIAIEAVNNSRSNPNSIIRAFDPLYHILEAAPSTGAIPIVDVGATQQHALLKYAALIDLDEELLELGVHALWIAPTTADPESMQQCIRTLAKIEQILPSTSRMIALNERDSKFEFFPASPADHVWHQELMPLLSNLSSFTVPRIEAGSWQPFEAAGLRFTDVISADIQQIQAWTGISRPEAKVIRGDVAVWMADLIEALTEPLNLQTEEASHAK
ncbi:ParA family protein [Kordiimonas aquimaris]|uniref:ParA family protein n=1 Tax=Kordiimonas aquimaris TaxID=707591 RepID=UPI0021D141A6|nr:ParA family protein [Kordiimonas aquimaris]